MVVSPKPTHPAEAIAFPNTVRLSLDGTASVAGGVFVSLGMRIRHHIGISLGLVTISTLGTAAANHYLIAKTYQSSALVMVVPGRHLRNLVEGQQFTETFAAMADSQQVLALAQTALASPMSQSSIRQHVTTAQIPNTNLFNVTATNTSPTGAATLANTLAQALKTRLDTLIGTPVLAVAAPAIPQLSHVSPSPMRADLLALLLSIMASILVASIRESLHTAIGSEAEIGRWTELSVLGAIPQFGLVPRKVRPRTRRTRPTNVKSQRPVVKSQALVPNQRRTRRRKRRHWL